MRYKPPQQQPRILPYTAQDETFWSFLPQTYENHRLYPLQSRKHLGRRPRGTKTSPPESCYSLTASRSERPFRSQAPARSAVLALAVRMSAKAKESLLLPSPSLRLLAFKHELVTPTPSQPQYRSLPCLRRSDNNAPNAWEDSLPLTRQKRCTLHTVPNTFKYLRCGRLKALKRVFETVRNWQEPSIRHTPVRASRRHTQGTQSAWHQVPRRSAKSVAFVKTPVACRKRGGLERSCADTGRQKLQIWEHSSKLK